MATYTDAQLRKIIAAAIEAALGTAPASEPEAPKAASGVVFTEAPASAKPPKATSESTIVRVGCAWGLCDRKFLPNGDGPWTHGKCYSQIAWGHGRKINAETTAMTDANKRKIAAAVKAGAISKAALYEGRITGPAKA